MALEVIYGESRNRAAAESLARRLTAIVDSGTVYLGYPVLATADERVEVDALLVSADHGLVAFLLADRTPVDESEWRQVRIRTAYTQCLKATSVVTRASARGGISL